MYVLCRLSENRHKEALHSRAHKLKHHYREVSVFKEIFKKNKKSARSNMQFKKNSLMKDVDSGKRYA